MSFSNVVSKLDGSFMTKHPSFDPDMKVSLHPALGLKPNYGKLGGYSKITETLLDMICL